MGQVQEDAQEFFMAALATTHRSLPVLEMLWLESQGYTNGTIDERWRAYAEDNAVPEPEKFNSFLTRDYVVANS